MKRITIIGDDNVGYLFIFEVLALVDTVYTKLVFCVKWSRGIRPRHAEPPNANIQVIAAPEIAHRILEHIATKYFDKYAMIAFLDDVEVVRGEKFAPKVIMNA